jgi:2,3-bisphosphoglycerate-dependent phosphoglycerate mutase
VTTLYLIRHAQALPLPEQDEPDWALSATGALQARGLVPVLCGLGIQRIYCSPFRRCRETLAPFAAAAGVEIQLDPGLRERRIAAQWVGDFREVWQRSWADFSYALEGGETSLVCRARIAAAVDAIVARHPGEVVALGSHGNAIGLFLNVVDSSAGVVEASALRTPELLRVVHRDGRYSWDRSFVPDAAFNALATDFRETPGVVA